MLDVKLEEDDYKFISQTKTAWQQFKNMFWAWVIALLIGFCLGKIYTWDTIISDCKVLGMFRIASTPFNCRIGINTEDKK